MQSCGEKAPSDKTSHYTKFMKGLYDDIEDPKRGGALHGVEERDVENLSVDSSDEEMVDFHQGGPRHQFGKADSF